MVSCGPSQNGFIEYPPQRHKAPAAPSTISPSELRISIGPRIRSGPFGAGEISSTSASPHSPEARRFSTTAAPARTSDEKCWPPTTRNAEVMPANPPATNLIPKLSVQLAPGRRSRCSVIPTAAPVHGQIGEGSGTSGDGLPERGQPLRNEHCLRIHPTTAGDATPTLSSPSGSSSQHERDYGRAPARPVTGPSCGSAVVADITAVYRPGYLSRIEVFLPNGAKIG